LLRRGDIVRKHTRIGIDKGVDLLVDASLSGGRMVAVFILRCWAVVFSSLVRFGIVPLVGSGLFPGGRFFLGRTQRVHRGAGGCTIFQEGTISLGGRSDGPGLFQCPLAWAASSHQISILNNELDRANSDLSGGDWRLM
jgi:hypothetical protein